MNDTLKILVRNGDVEIKYEQTIERSTTFAATTADEYAKASSNEQLLKTISQLCREVKLLSSGKSND